MVNSSLFRRIELQMLMNLTARALGQKPKRIWTLSNAEALRAYAEYTCSNLQADADETLFERMNTGAYRMGRLLRQLFLISNCSDRFTVGIVFVVCTVFFILIDVAQSCIPGFFRMSCATLDLITKPKNLHP